EEARAARLATTPAITRSSQLGGVAPRAVLQSHPPPANATPRKSLRSPWPPAPPPPPQPLSMTPSQSSSTSLPQISGPEVTQEHVFVAESQVGLVGGQCASTRHSTQTCGSTESSHAGVGGLQSASAPHPSTVTIVGGLPGSLPLPSVGVSTTGAP